MPAQWVACALYREAKDTSEGITGCFGKHCPHGVHPADPSFSKKDHFSNTSTQGLTVACMCFTVHFQDCNSALRHSGGHCYGTLPLWQGFPSASMNACSHVRIQNIATKNTKNTAIRRAKPVDAQQACSNNSGSAPN